MRKNIIIMAVTFLLILSACGKGIDSMDTNKKRGKNIIISFNSGFVYKENDKYMVHVTYLNKQEQIIVYNKQRECESNKDILLAGSIDFSRYLNQSFDEVIHDFGTIHTDIGSGRYIPAFFTNDAYLVSFDLDDNIVMDVIIIDLLSGHTTSCERTDEKLD